MGGQPGPGRPSGPLPAAPGRIGSPVAESGEIGRRQPAGPVQLIGPGVGSEELGERGIGQLGAMGHRRPDAGGVGHVPGQVGAARGPELARLLDGLAEFVEQASRRRVAGQLEEGGHAIEPPPRAVTWLATRSGDGRAVRVARAPRFLQAAVEGTAGIVKRLAVGDREERGQEHGFDLHGEGRIGRGLGPAAFDDRPDRGRLERSQQLARQAVEPAGSADQGGDGPRSPRSLVDRRLQHPGEFAAPGSGLEPIGLELRLRAGLQVRNQADEGRQRPGQGSLPLADRLAAARPRARTSPARRPRPRRSGSTTRSRRPAGATAPAPRAGWRRPRQAGGGPTPSTPAGYWPARHRGLSSRPSGPCRASIPRASRHAPQAAGGTSAPGCPGAIGTGRGSRRTARRFRRGRRASSGRRSRPPRRRPGPRRGRARPCP